MRRLPAVLLVLAIVAGGAGLWYFRMGELKPISELGPDALPDEDWLGALHNQNPRIAEAAARHVEGLGADALPQVRQVLQDPSAEAARKKAALKACGILGPLARPAVQEVAAHLPTPDYTTEAAVALSFMGRDAFAPL